MKAAAIILRPFKTVTLLLQCATPDASTRATIESVLDLMVKVLDDETAQSTLEPVRVPITAAAAPQQTSRSLVAIVTRDDKGAITVTNIPTTPHYTAVVGRPAVVAVAAVKAVRATATVPAVAAVAAVKASPAVSAAAAAVVAWEAVVATAHDAVLGGKATYNKRVAPVLHLAMRRDAASLYDVTRPELDKIDFADLLDGVGAFPYVAEGEEAPDVPWSWRPKAVRVAAAPPAAAAAVAAAVSSDDDSASTDDGKNEYSLGARLKLQWAEFNERRLAGRRPPRHDRRQGVPCTLLD